MTDHAKSCKMQEVDADWTECFILAWDERQSWLGTARHHLEPVYSILLSLHDFSIAYRGNILV